MSCRIPSTDDESPPRSGAAVQRLSWDFWCRLSIASQCPPWILDLVRRRFRHVARARIVTDTKKSTYSTLSALPVARPPIHGDSDPKGHVGGLYLVAQGCVVRATENSAARQRVSPN